MAWVNSNSTSQETRAVAKKNYLLGSLSREKWFCEDLGSGSETYVKGQTVNTSDVMDHIDSCNHSALL